MAAKFMPTLVIIVCMTAALVVRGVGNTSAGTIVAPAIAGDVLVVTTTAGQRILVDTGNDAPQLLELLGSQTPFWASHSADILVLTQSGQAWQGALGALLDHGVAQVLLLPAARSGAQARCQTGHAQCHDASVGSQWQYDDVTIHVVAPNMVWLVWASGSMLVAHGATTTQLNAGAPTLGCPRRPCMVSYGWQITPPWRLHDALHPNGVLYSSGQTQRPPARFDMAQRRPYHEQLWHEQLHGTITVTLGHPTHIRVSEVFP